MNEYEFFDDELEDDETPMVPMGGMMPMGGGDNGDDAPEENGGNEMADTPKVYTSYQVYLMHKPSGGSWGKLVDIRDFPDVHGAPNPLDATTLSHPAESQTKGIKRSGEKTFTALYSKTDYVKVNALKGVEQEIGIWFGANATTGEPDGANGKFQGKGYVSAKVTSKGVDEVLEMEITVAMTEGFKAES